MIMQINDFELIATYVAISGLSLILASISKNASEPVFRVIIGLIACVVVPPIFSCIHDPQAAPPYCSAGMVISSALTVLAVSICVLIYDNRGMIFARKYSIRLDDKNYKVYRYRKLLETFHSLDKAEEYVAYLIIKARGDKEVEKLAKLDKANFNKVYKLDLNKVVEKYEKTGN